ncbi:GNAT family N-acetyltransferase [Pseudomonas sp. ZM23]|uniref:GNAT family N-acetyltransferase n=1 Tax=Pseudomonas triclosanedens TaxID=2961893 RepID=A0ABY6ZVW6_9PSED|nr:GNAT family N-acetyltransferase [Pseudomonas triclosanedens]MCP8465278.1 GNAT family N-acetyltransferase [Pseudomonas triclosanedens]MCP8470782.1 GNAT family N-acetyltransferase [Pseudomonas triclosanedens]MCP8476527.1 GNAT family N-acetyltransferase [Pseudomonas triclosanedens]WAI48966.1 GNAT family N-acetyltransferase [Pseudomonas triclosanedens]
MSITLRQAVDADAGFAAVCVAAAYAQWIPLIGRKPGPMLEDYHTVIATNQVLIAELGGQPVGLLVTRQTDEGFLLDNIAVLPECAGQGIGRLLLVRAEEEASRQGYQSLYLYTNERMIENIELYARIGYREYARRQENGFRRVYMRKQLG